MRIGRVRFKIGRLMIAVAVAALVLTPFAWSAPESRATLLIGALTGLMMFLIVSSPFVIDTLERGAAKPKPRPGHARPLPAPLRLLCFLWTEASHRRQPPNL